MSVAAAGDGAHHAGSWGPAQARRGGGSRWRACAGFGRLAAAERARACGVHSSGLNHPPRCCFCCCCRRRNGIQVVGRQQAAGTNGEGGRKGGAARDAPAPPLTRSADAAGRSRSRPLDTQASPWRQRQQPAAALPLPGATPRHAFRTCRCARRLAGIGRVPEGGGEGASARVPRPPPPGPPPPPPPPHLVGGARCTA